MGVGQWPWEALAAVVVACTALMTALGRGCWKLLQSGSDNRWKMHERGWDRVTELDEEVRRLRVALSRSDQRSNVYATVSEVLTLAMPFELESRVAAVRHARLIAEQHIQSGGQGVSGQ